jgi:hypothetical protein
MPDKEPDVEPVKLEVVMPTKAEAKHMTEAQLDELRSKLEERISHTDSKNIQEREADRVRIEKLEKYITELESANEAKNKPKPDDNTMVVPPVATEVTPTPAMTPEQEDRIEEKRGWKKLW